MYLSDIEADEEPDHDRRKFECIECGTDLVLPSPSPFEQDAAPPKNRDGGEVPAVRAMAPTKTALRRS